MYWEFFNGRHPTSIILFDIEKKIDRKKEDERTQQQTLKQKKERNVKQRRQTANEAIR